MTPETRIVVARTGRNEDSTLIRYARVLAEQHRTAEHSTIRQPGLPVDASKPTPVAVAEAADVVLSTPQLVDCVHVSPGQSEALLTLAANSSTAALLVGAGIGARSLQRLVRQAACSVWYVPDGSTTAIRRLLVPVDFSVRSADSLRVATAIARLHGVTQLQALHVYFDESPLANRASDAALRARLAQTYDRFARPIDTLQVRVDPLFREYASVPHGIDRTAREQSTDLIVLASRGRTRASALLHESVAEQTIRHCRVPVLVVKHFGAQLGLLQILRDARVRGRSNPRFH